MKKYLILLFYFNISYAQNFNCDSTCFSPFDDYKGNKSQTINGNNNSNFIESKSLSCPNGYTGNIIQNRYISINNGNTFYGNWTNTNNNCKKILLNNKCPNGYQGYYVKNEVTNENIWTCTPIQTN